mgnify:FL=1
MTSKLLWKSSNGKWTIRKGSKFASVIVSDGSIIYDVDIDPAYVITWNPPQKGIPKYVLAKVEALLDGMIDSFWENDANDKFYIPNHKEIRPCPVCGSTSVSFECDEVQTDIDRFDPCPPGQIICEDCLACTLESDDTDELLRIWNGGRVRHRFVDGGNPIPITAKAKPSGNRRRGATGNTRASKFGVKTTESKRSGAKRKVRSNNDRGELTPGQEVSREIYEQYQYDGYPYRIPVSLLDRYGCVRGFAAGHVARDPGYHRAFGETADGRCLYLGLTRVKRYDDVPDGPPTWYEEYYHQPKTKGGRR